MSDVCDKAAFIWVWLFFPWWDAWVVCPYHSCHKVLSVSLIARLCTKEEKSTTATGRERMKDRKQRMIKIAVPAAVATCMYTWASGHGAASHISNKATALTCPYLLQPFAMNSAAAAAAQPQRPPCWTTEEIKLQQRTWRLSSPPSRCAQLSLFAQTWKLKSFCDCFITFNVRNRAILSAWRRNVNPGFGALQSVMAADCVPIAPARWPRCSRHHHTFFPIRHYAKRNLNPAASNLAFLPLLFPLCSAFVYPALSSPPLWWAFYLTAHLFTPPRSQSWVSPLIILPYSPFLPYRRRSSRSWNYMRFSWVPAHAKPPQRTGRGARWREGWVKTNLEIVKRWIFPDLDPADPRLPSCVSVSSKQNQ